MNNIMSTIETGDANTAPTIRYKSRKKVKKEKHKSPIALYLQNVEDKVGDLKPNNFRLLRIRKKYTVQGLADKTGLSKQAIIRTEQAVYPVPPVGLLDFWLKQGYNYKKLMDEYGDYQLNIRQRHHKLFGEPILDLECYKDKHPNQVLRLNWTNPDGTPVGYVMNVTEQAKLLCVSQSVLNYFENSVKQQHSVPMPLSSALRDAGYSVRFLEDLDRAYVAYRKQVLVNG